MTILTDGPRLESADKWSDAYIRQLEAAHQHEIIVHAVYGAIALVLLVALWIAVPRAWRWARAQLAGPVQMPDPDSLPRA